MWIIAGAKPNLHATVLSVLQNFGSGSKRSAIGSARQHNDVCRNQASGFPVRGTIVARSVLSKFPNGAKQAECKGSVNLATGDRQHRTGLRRFGFTPHDCLATEPTRLRSIQTKVLSKKAQTDFLLRAYHYLTSLQLNKSWLNCSLTGCKRPGSTATIRSST